MMLSHIPVPNLPIPPSWFPGHMMKFTRMLPGLLTRTNVVLEIRDSRLPLTSINRRLEGALQKWKFEHGWDPNNQSHRLVDTGACEHIVVLNKRDLVPEWGIEPFRLAMAKKFPGQQVLFASWQRPRDIRHLNGILIDIAKKYPHSMELNVLVIGMPNVGKSTLLNALRNMGIKGRTPKVFQTSAQPGLTQALSTRLKVSLDPLVYAFDTPGVMLPFLGRGIEGAERGVKLALIEPENYVNFIPTAGIKEGLYDIEALAAYLLYRLNVLNPSAPAYLKLLPAGALPTIELHHFLEQLAQRMGMIKRGAELDTTRAAMYFVRWWREEGGLIAASSPLQTSRSSTPNTCYNAIQGWGFDFQWQLELDDHLKDEDTIPKIIQKKMETCIDEYLITMEREENEENNISPTQIKKQQVQEEKMRRKQKYIKR